jgi:hypothetical protein
MSFRLQASRPAHYPHGRPDYNSLFWQALSEGPRFAAPKARVRANHGNVGVLRRAALAGNHIRLNVARQLRRRKRIDMHHARRI